MVPIFISYSSEFSRPALYGSEFWRSISAILYGEWYEPTCRRKSFAAMLLDGLPPASAQMLHAEDRPQRSIADDVAAWVAARRPTSFDANSPAARIQRRLQSGSINTLFQRTTPYPDRCPAHRTGWALVTRHVRAQIAAKRRGIRRRLVRGCPVTACFMLAVALIVISRHLDVQILVLVMLAACRRRLVWDDLVAPIRRNLTSFGEMPKPL